LCLLHTPSAPTAPPTLSLHDALPIYRLAHRLIHYMADREQFCRRWEGAIESTQVPLQFVWGMADPVSGAHVADRIRARLPGARLDRKSTRLNSSHGSISYAVFCLKKK